MGSRYLFIVLLVVPRAPPQPRRLPPPGRCRARGLALARRAPRPRGCYEERATRSRERSELPAPVRVPLPRHRPGRARRGVAGDRRARLPPSWAGRSACSIPPPGRGEFINAVPAPERWAVDLRRLRGGHAPRRARASCVSDIFEADLPSEHFDGVFVSNFLEHLPTQDAVRGLPRAHARASLAPGGRIAIMGPNFRFCAERVLRLRRPHAGLTHIAIAEHLYAAGFEPRARRAALPAVLVPRPAAAAPRAHAPLPADAARVAAAREAVPGRRAALKRRCSRHAAPAPLSRTLKKRT